MERHLSSFQACCSAPKTELLTSASDQPLCAYIHKTVWIGNGADQHLCAYIPHSLGLETVQTKIFVLTFSFLGIGSGADQRFGGYIQNSFGWKRCRPTSLCVHATLFGMEAVQTNVFALTFNTLWIGNGADQPLCAYIQNSLDWQRCRPTSLCLHSTIFGLETVDQRRCAYSQHSLDWKRYRPTSLCLHSTLFGLEAAQTNVFVRTCNNLWIGSGADQRLCAYIQHSLDWKQCRPTSPCLHSTLFGLEAVQTNVFVLTFNNLWIGSGADQRLCAYIQHSLDWKR